jgi:repressor LexA
MVSESRRKYSPQEWSLLSRLKLPVTGRIAAGSPIESIEQQEILDLAAILCDASCYVLIVKGNSMIGEGILDGDNIICKRQSTAQEGDIAVVLIDGEKATLKRIHYKLDGMIELEAANPEFKSQIYSLERISIQGVFIGLLRLYSGNPKKTKELNRVTEIHE